MPKAVNSEMFVLPDEMIISKIYLIRGYRVMLDEDLAELYQVDTKRLNEQVKRNINRFPDDFMFQLTSQAFNNLKSQFATSSWGGRRKRPFTFTEQGVSMLSGILNSKIAIEVHIRIIRIFTRMRKMMLTNKDILLRLEKMETELKENRQDVEQIFEVLKQLLHQPPEKRTMIGFKPGD